MKRFLALALVLFAISHSVTPVCALNPDHSEGQEQSAQIIQNTGFSNSPSVPTLELDAQGAVLIEQETGKILYEKNKDEKLYPASTTKVLTALLAIENGNLDEIITVGNEVFLTPRGSSLACIDIGEEISLKNLLYGLMLSSGNDAALTIGAHIARVVADDPDLPYNQALNKFSQLMNTRAAELGATGSNFVNPHGFHDANHYSTAYDLAMISREAMKHQVFRDIVQITYMEYPDWDEFDENDPSKRATRYWVNKNRLLNESNAKEYYPYATGIKTGYTSHSGHCLVSSATKDGLNLIAVVLKSTRDGQWTDSKKLLEYGFTNYTMYEPLKDGQVVTTIQVANHAPDDSGTLNIVAAQGFRDVFPKDNIAKIQQITEWYYTDENGLLHLEAPVFKGQVVGRLTYKIDNQAVAQIKLIAERGVLKKKSIIDMITPEPNENISGSSGKRPHLWAVLVFLVILFINIVYVLRRKRRKRYNYLRRYR